MFQIKKKKKKISFIRTLCGPDNLGSTALYLQYNNNNVYYRYK